MSQKQGSPLGNLCQLACFGTVVAFFGIYAFGNPDLAKQCTEGEVCEPTHCFIAASNPNICEALPSPYESTEAGIDMTAKFLGLFTWGFIIQVLPVAGVILMLLGGLTKVAFLAVVGGLSAGCAQPAHLIWVIITACQAWSNNAKVIAGENIVEINAHFTTTDANGAEIHDTVAEEAYMAMTMPASQNFLNVWAWIFVISYGLGLLCCLVMCAVARQHLEDMMAGAKGHFGQ